jgi:hypothetical protein
MGKFALYGVSGQLNSPAALPLRKDPLAAVLNLN